MVLVFNLVSGSDAGLALNPAREIADIQRCVHVLKEGEKRIPIAGRFWYAVSLC
jgi:hypothetical protein